MEYVCKCLNCDRYLYDENPQIGAVKHDVSNLGEVFPMELLNDDGESYFGCGECQTDSYLTDLYHLL